MLEDHLIAGVLDNPMLIAQAMHFVALMDVPTPVKAEEVLLQGETMDAKIFSKSFISFDISVICLPAND